MTQKSSIKGRHDIDVLSFIPIHSILNQTPAEHIFKVVAACCLAITEP